MIPTIGYAAMDPKSPLRPFRFERRAVGADDVRIEILYCGVCHSDLHTARNEWNNTLYPCVPGHEIVGRVAEVGKDVKRFKVDDVVGVGCMVDSCLDCPSCTAGMEQYCEHGFTGTYNGPVYGGENTYGGYSQTIVVKEHFVLRMPTQPNLAACAPLLCAGITTFSPLRHWRVSAGHKVGVVGLGGLGHMAIKLAAAMGAQVVLFSRSPGKKEDALRLGASEMVLSTDPDAMARHANSFNLILDTVAAPHKLDDYLTLLRRDGTMVLLGAPDHPHPSPEVFNLIFKRRTLAGSLIGGIPETQEMLDFCAAHNITCDIELIPIQSINQAYERMLRSDVRYRFVIDMHSLSQEASTA